MGSRRATPVLARSTAEVRVHAATLALPKNASHASVASKRQQHSRVDAGFSASIAEHLMTLYSDIDEDRLRSNSLASTNALSHQLSLSALPDELARRLDIIDQVSAGRFGCLSTSICPCDSNGMADCNTTFGIVSCTCWSC